AEQAQEIPDEGPADEEEAKKGDEDGQPVVKKRRKKGAVADEANSFVFAYFDLMSRQGWSKGALVRLSVVASKIMDEIASSTRVITAAFRKELAALGEPRPQLSSSWTRNFPQGLEAPNRAAKKAPARQTAEQIDEATRSLKLKIAFVRKMHDIPWDRVWGFDETSIQLLPTYRRGRAKQRNKAVVAGDDKTNVTPALTHGTSSSQLLCQLIFKGKTERSQPKGVDACPWLTMTQTENRWVNDGTALEAIRRIDEEVDPRVVIRSRPWPLVRGACPARVSRGMRGALIGEFPNVKTVFVNANFTGSSQPADVALFSPLESFIRRLACEDLRSIIAAKIDDPKPLAKVIKKTVLNNKIVGWVQGGMQRLQEKDKSFEKARRKPPVKEERLDVECEAEQEHNAGKLFRRAGRNQIVPEHPPGDEEAELPAEDLQRPEEEARGLFEEERDEEPQWDMEVAIDPDPELPPDPFSPEVPTEIAALPPELPPDPFSPEAPPESDSEAPTEVAALPPLSPSAAEKAKQLMKHFAALRIAHGDRDPSCSKTSK
ncbi:unnamed protein product, partial [Prorocentrum cordatum]